MKWLTGEFGSSHEGMVGVLLDDGVEPGAVWISTSLSGAGGRETREWWAYNGAYGCGPRASYLRGSCSCGWRGDDRYPIDWSAIEDWPRDVDTSGPLEDWDRHITEIEALVVPLPKDIEELLEHLEVRLEALAGESKLASLRAVAAVERIAKQVGWNAARDVDPHETPWAQISKALGLTEKGAQARLMSYKPRR